LRVPAPTCCGETPSAKTPTRAFARLIKSCLKKTPTARRTCGSCPPWISTNYWPSGGYYVPALPAMSCRSHDDME
jgi:hypothetical protein